MQANLRWLESWPALVVLVLAVIAVPSEAGAAAESQPSPAEAPAAPGGPSGSGPSPDVRASVLEALGAMSVESFLAALEADRLLLAEARKDLPTERNEADAYLARLKGLAAKSDPVRLVPRVERMIEQAPLYYDWLAKNREKGPADPTEYVVGGARGFLVAYQEFQNTLLLIVINRLQIAGHAIGDAMGVPY